MVRFEAVAGPSLGDVSRLLRGLCPRLDCVDSGAGESYDLRTQSPKRESRLV